SKLSHPVVGQIVELRAQGHAIRAIAELVGVSVGSVAGALSQARNTMLVGEAANTSQKSAEDDASDHDDNLDAADGDGVDGADGLPLLAEPVDRSGERTLALFGLLDEAMPVFTAAARVP